MYRNYPVKITRHPRLLAVIACVLAVCCPPQLFAQSDDGADSDAAAARQALIEALEKQLEQEKQALQAVIEQREVTRDEQQQVRDQLEAEQAVQDGHAEKLQALCEEYNAASTGELLDCEKELGE